MSCHGTPGNRAITSVACALTHTPSDDVSRRFHELKREADPSAPAPTPDELERWWDRQAMAVRGDESLTAWRRARLGARLAEARAQEDTPDGATWHAWQNLRAACDDAHTHAWLAAAAGQRLPLAEQPPEHVDQQLADLWDRIHQDVGRRDRIAHSMRHAERSPGRRGTDQDYLDRLRADLAAAEARIDTLVDQTEPFEAEYRRRGGWARYFRVVTSGAGHVHSSRNCSTCYPTTAYAWLPSLSGKNEDEAVDDYGSEMCSVCFPSARSHPSYRTRGRIAEEASARRAIVQAERQAARDAKSISSPDGSPLRLRGGYPDTISTAVSAERELIARMAELRSSLSPQGIDDDVAAFDTQRSGGMRPTEDYRDILVRRGEMTRDDVATLAAALAHKRGQAVHEVLDSVEDRVVKRARRENRERARAQAAWAARNRLSPPLGDD